MLAALGTLIFVWIIAMLVCTPDMPRIVGMLCIGSLVACIAAIVWAQH